MTCGGQQYAFAASSLPQIPTEEEEEKSFFGCAVYATSYLLKQNTLARYN